MQDAYFQEKGNVGGWVDIGYSAPGEKHTGYSYSSNVFNYSGNDAACGGSTACYWRATAKQKLNDCQIGSGWQLDATANGSADASGTYAHFVISTNTSNTSGDCKSLTASWDNLTGSH